MKFLKLIIMNYKSFQSSTQIDFPISNDGRSIFLIGGMNGSGKTSIMEAITYCLYGGKAEDIFHNINRREKAKGNPHVSFQLVIELDDLSELVVTRSWNIAKGVELTPRQMTEQLEVIRDGKIVSIKNQEIWQDFIRAQIPPGITQFFFFDGEKIQEIAAEEHSETRLKGSLEAVLGIQFINRLIEDIKQIKREEIKDFIEISDADLEYKQSELKKEISNKERKLKERNNLQEEISEFKSQLDVLKSQFEAIFHMAPKFKDKLHEIDKKRNSLVNKLSKLKSEILVFCENDLPFALTGKYFSGIKQQIEKERESAGSAVVREQAGELAKRIVKVVEEPEPIFYIKLSEERLSELERRIYKVLSEGDKKTDDIKLLHLSERDAAIVLNKIERLEKSNLSLIKQLIDESDDVNDQLSSLEDLNKDMSLTPTQEVLFNELQDKIESLSVQTGRKKEQLSLIVEEILNIEERISKIEIEIDSLYEKHAISNEKREFIDECTSINALLEEFIIRLRQNKVNLLQEKVFEMYKRLSSRSSLIKDININKNTYEIRITDRNDHTIRKSALSAGEKEVFAISLLWGLGQTSELKLPIIVDTPLSRLDSMHRDNIVNHYFPNAGSQVIILSTDTEIDTHYYRSLKPHLTGSGMLEFNQKEERTVFKQGYFWES